MRVIAGSKRGSKLFTPRSNAIRPVTDRVKQYLFEILKYIVSGANVLDLFAGTGSLGIEALSRGAAFCTFVDNDPESIDLIKKNLIKLDLVSRAEVRKDSVENILLGMQTSYRIIFLDPPYEFAQTISLVNEIDQKRYLQAQGALIVEHDERVNFHQHPFTNMKVVRGKKFGQTHISFFQVSEEAP
jgi:16S rRNA (guanine(966)-N(2))-methyltransferase RsmD